MVLLWFFKSPGFMPGWADLYTTSAVPGDSTVALLFAGLLFIVPKELPRGQGFFHGLKNLRLDRPIITWPEFQAYCPWGTIFLIGSGMALSKASTESGFSQFIADLLTGLSDFSEIGILFVVVISIGLLTEITSNTATANLFLSILMKLAVNLGLNPLYLVVPATLATSLAFMLPVATGPNALIFSFGRISIPDMVKNGLLLNVLGFMVIGLMGHVYTPVILNTDDKNATWITEGVNAVC